MRRILTTALFATLLTCLAIADDQWTGRLVDANCSKGDGTPHACDPSPDSTNFGLVLDTGKAYVFDAKGNQKVSEAMKSRAAAADSNQKLPSTVKATVDGTEMSNTISVRSIVLE
jgi:hypothetical protein